MAITKDDQLISTLRNECSKFSDENKKLQYRAWAAEHDLEQIKTTLSILLHYAQQDS